MDPISALSVAGVAVQFLDFSSKLIVKVLRTYRQLADAENGPPGPIADIKLVARRLKDLTQQIDNVLISVESQRPLTSTEEGVAAAARECGSLSAELLAVLKKASPQWFVDDSLDVVVHGAEVKTTIWSRVREAIRIVRKAEDIEKLQQKLDGFRQQLMVEILATLFERLSPPNDGIPQRNRTMPKFQSEKGKEKLGTDSCQIEQWNLNLDNAIGKNTQRMLDSREYYTPKLELSDWTSTPVGESLMKRFLDHLWYPEIVTRERRIAQAHEETFEWIFRSTEASTAPVRGSFREWLRKGSDTFWVTGKPGSGKSTLFKFIHNDPRTKEYLQEWAPDRPLVTAAFFFWNSGSELQMSQAGMIQSLLYQCLRQHHVSDLSASKPPRYWDTFILSQNFEKPWTWSELIAAFQVLIRQCEKSETSYFFLIDGLDEFNGPKSDLINLLSQLTRLSNVKICLSSRPWPVFEDAYKQKPSLTVQELTQHDIKHYVTTNFQNHLGFHELLEASPEYGHLLLSHITTKASGVFLWVVLVVKSLLDGLTNGDRLEDLQRRLDELPDDLESLFSKMMDSMEPRYYKSASELFQIFRAAKRRPTLICMSYAHEENESLALQQAIRPIQQNELRYRALAMKRRLNTTCKGLLEVNSSLSVADLSDHCDSEPPSSDNLLKQRVWDAQASDFAESQVEYLHRTVKDWLSQHDIWEQITKATPASFNPVACLARAHLLQLKSLPPDTLSRPEYGFWDLLIWCTEYCGEVGKTNQRLEAQLLEEMNRVGIVLSTATHHRSKSYVQRFWGSDTTNSFHWASTVSGGLKSHGFLNFVVRCQLYRYLQYKLASTKHKPAEISSLLRTALLSYMFAPGLGDAPSCNHVVRNEQIIKLLLRNGGMPDVGHASSTQGTMIERVKSTARTLRQKKKTNRSNSASEFPSLATLVSEGSGGRGLTTVVDGDTARRSFRNYALIGISPMSEKDDRRYASTLYNFRMHSDDEDD